jgi:hypothetical protein
MASVLWLLRAATAAAVLVAHTCGADWSPGLQKQVEQPCRPFNASNAQPNVVVVGLPHMGFRLLHVLKATMQGSFKIVLKPRPEDASTLCDGDQCFVSLADDLCPIDVLEASHDDLRALFNKSTVVFHFSSPARHLTANAFVEVHHIVRAIPKSAKYVHVIQNASLSVSSAETMMIGQILHWPSVGSERRTMRVLRLHHVYGPVNFTEPPDTMGPVGSLIVQALSSDALHLPSGSPRLFDLIHVTDVVTALRDAIRPEARNRSGMAVEVGTGQVTSIEELVEAVARLAERCLGRRLRVELPTRSSWRRPRCLPPSTLTTPSLRSSATLFTARHRLSPC